MNRPPAFQFYPKDFLMDDKVIVMNLEEIGAYIKLLCLCWNNNGLTKDQKELKNMCGNPNNWDAIWVRVGKCFYEKKGKFYNKRLEKELKKQKAWKKKSQLGGIKSGISRRGMVEPKVKGGSTKPKPPLNSSSSSSSSITIKNKEKNKPIVLQIITHLNEKAKTNYSPKTKITTEYINGRIADGFKLDDFLYVIDVKCEDWIGDLEMEKFLRPKTLFATSNFEGYLNQKRERKSNHMVGGRSDNEKVMARFEKQKLAGDFDDLDNKED